MDKKRLWIISELFPPEETSTGYIMGEIANTLVDKYEVKVICGPEVYDKQKKISKGTSINPNIEIFRVKGVTENKHNKLSRIKKFLLMSYRIYSLAKSKIQNGDTVLMVSNPFPLILMMAQLRKKKNFTLKMLVHDVFPESLFTDLNLPSFIYKLSATLFNNAYSTPDLLIVLGRDMQEIMTQKTKGRTDIKIIENWADVENIYPTENESGKIIIQYAGNIGKAQGVGDFIDCIHQSENKNLDFDVWGSGNDIDNIKEKINKYGIESNVHLKGTYLRNEQTQVLNSCDIALVTLVKGMYGLGTPSKSYNIMAAGKPILYIGERGTEIWRTVEETGIGYCFEPGNQIGIITFLNNISKAELEKRGKKARLLAEKKYAKKLILEKFKQII